MVIRATKYNYLARMTTPSQVGHALGLRVVAESIEDRATWDLLVGMDCDVAQGYSMSRPLPATDLQRWVLTSSFGLTRGVG